MPIYSKINNEWTLISAISNKISTVYKTISYGYIKVSNTWKLFYTLSQPVYSNMIKQSYFITYVRYVTVNNSSNIFQEVIIYE